jgi:hypothetical protein
MGRCAPARTGRAVSLMSKTSARRHAAPSSAARTEIATSTARPAPVTCSWRITGRPIEPGSFLVERPVSPARAPATRDLGPHVRRRPPGRARRRRPLRAVRGPATEHRFHLPRDRRRLHRQPCGSRSGRLRAAAGTRRGARCPLLLDKRASSPTGSSRLLGTSSERLEAPWARARFGGEATARRS